MYLIVDKIDIIMTMNMCSSAMNEMNCLWV